uniref:Transposase n=1 Tax=Acrobeloides nanus TaxID=290746 RepID=A0A914DUK3_9BILA
MGRRATQSYKYARKVIEMPDDTISLQISLDARRSARCNHEFILATQPTKWDAHFSGSLNTIRRIWNNLPRETCQINSLTNSKKAMKTPTSMKT